MFGRKIPDKVMGPGTPPEQEKTQMDNKATANRGTPPARAETPTRRPNSTGVGSVLGEDTVFSGGKIVSKGTLRIDGRVEAEIEAEDSVVIGPNGVVKADIKARHIAISGKVVGNVVATERLELQPSSVVQGDVQTAAGALIIEGGARLEGRCLMGLDERAPEKGKSLTPAESDSAEAKSKEPQKAAKS